MSRIGRHLMIATAALVARATTAQACSVCGGDKSSPLVQGALSGVVVMVCITYGVLFCFAGMIVSCVVRARRLARAESKPERDGDSTGS